MSAEDGPGRREVAVRVFAREFDDATHSYSESDEERAPTYVTLPTGARVNRVFVVGVLTAVESVSDDVLRGRIADPTGAVVCYAGQYQPDAQRFLEGAEAPEFVALTGKARTFQPEDSDAIYTSIRPETITTVDADTRDRWVVQTAAATLERCRVAADALEADRRGEALTDWLAGRGVHRALAAGLPRAIDAYDLGDGYLSATAALAVDALAVVADERDAVAGHDRPLDARSDGRPDIPTIDSPLAVGGFTAARHDRTPGVAPSESAAPGPDPEESESTPSAAPVEENSTAHTSDGVADPAPANGEATVTTASAESESATTDSTPTESEAEVTATGEVSTESTGIEDAAGETATEHDTTEADTTEHDTTEDVAIEDGEFDLDEETRESIESEYGTEFTSGTEVDEPGAADIDTPDPEELEAEAPPAADRETAGDDSPDRGEAAAGASSVPESASGTGADAVTEAEGATDAATGTDESPTDADGPDEGVDAEEGSDAAAVSAEDSETATDAVDAADDTDEPADTDEEPSETVNLESAALEAMAERDDGDGVDRETLVADVAEEADVDPSAVDDAIEDALMSGLCYEPTEGTLKPI